MAKKITQYPASGGNPDVGSLIDVSELSAGVYTSTKLTIQQLLNYLSANLSVGGTTQFFNNTGAGITKGTPIQVGTGVTGLLPNLKKIGSSDAINDGKIFIANQNILNNATGSAIESGVIQFFSTFAIGDKIFWDIATQNYTNVSTNEDQIFVGIIIVGSPSSSGKMFVAPRFSPSLIKGTNGEIPLFVGDRKINSNTHFTWIDNAGAEVGFTFDDGRRNITKVGVNFTSMESEGTAYQPVLRLASWNNNTNKGIISFRKSRGTKALPTQVLTSDVLGTFTFDGQTTKTVDGASPTPTFMTTGEIIIRALANFSRNYNSVMDITTASSLTQLEFWLQPTSGFFGPGDGIPPNQKVFSVTGDGRVYFKNYNFPIPAGTVGQTLITDGSGNLTWQTPSASGLVGAGSLNKIAFWTDPITLTYDNAFYKSFNSGSFVLNIDNSLAGTVAQLRNRTIIGDPTGFYQETNGYSQLQINSSSDSLHPILQLTRNRGVITAKTPYLNGDILGQFRMGAGNLITAVATENYATGWGVDYIFTSSLNGTTNAENEVMRISQNGKVKIGNTYFLPKTDGLAGTSLITDGAGNVAWGTVSAGASTSLQTIGRNSTGATLYAGTIVFILNSTGNRPNFVKAKADSEITSSGTFGVVVSNIANNSDGYVVTTGAVSGLDTRSVATNPFTTDTLFDGDTIYLSPFIAGYVTNVKPSSPNHIVSIGQVVQTSPTNGTIVYRIQNGYELDEIHDVQIGALANNDVLQFDLTAGVWKNKQLTASEDIWNASGNETYRGVSFNNNTTTVVVDGGVVMSSTASTLAQTVNQSYLAVKQIRLRYYASVVSAGRYTGTRGTQLLWYIAGGFRFVCDFNISDTSYSAGCQQFYGLAGQTTDLNYGSVSNILVSTLTNIVGVGNEVGDTNLQIFYNDATGTASKIDLGVEFPANRTVGAISTTVYSIILYNEPMSTSVTYRVINKETGAVASGTLTTDLPATSQGLNFFASRCMSVTSVTSTGQFDLMKLGVFSQL